MTQQEQQIAAAELDGFRFTSKCHPPVYNAQGIATRSENGTLTIVKALEFFKYDDYNTIIPLIQKWCKATPRGWIIFLCALTKITTPFDEIQTLDKAQGFYNATPDQLRKALLKAAGKWKEDAK